jgi:hypothetical protein
MLKIPQSLESLLTKNGSGVLAGHFSGNFDYQTLKDAYSKQLRGERINPKDMTINLSLGVESLGTMQGSHKVFYLETEKGGLGHSYNDTIRRFSLLVSGEKGKLCLYLDFFEYSSKFGTFLITTVI